MATWAGIERHFFDQTDSTNKQARRLAASGAPHGTICVANHQSAGRGRRGRVWESGPCMSLMLSIVLRPATDAAQRPLLSFAIALAAADACTAACGISAGIKWPNDIIINQKKVAGILLENEGNAVVAGIGINVFQTENDFPKEIRETAASLQSQSSQKVSMEALEATFLDAVEKHVDSGNYLAAYRSRCMTIGKRVQVSSDHGCFVGVAVDLDPSGALLVHSEGVIRAVFAGDVSVRGEDGYV